MDRDHEASVAHPADYQRFLDGPQSGGYSSRYAGAMVADVHRICRNEKR
jgi:fructose-1,6-bisphosphatase